MDDVESKRAIAYDKLAEFSSKRQEYYSDPRKVTLDKLLQKDIIMFAARGVETAEEFVKESFRAIESSSEETVMGTMWQSVIASISYDTIDSGDLTTVRDNTIYYCELKSQKNTVNSSSFPQELRELKDKIENAKRYSRASNQPIEAAFCILKSKDSADEWRTYEPADRDFANQDIKGFRYRYLVGSAFWHWLTGFDSVDGLVNDLSKLNASGVAQARNKRIECLIAEMNQALDRHDLPHTIQGVLDLKRSLF